MDFIIGGLTVGLLMFLFILLPLIKKYNRLVEVKNRMVKRRQVEFKINQERNEAVLTEIKERLER